MHTPPTLTHTHRATGTRTRPPSCGHRLCVTRSPAVHLGELPPALGLAVAPPHSSSRSRRENSFHLKTAKNSEPAVGAAANAHKHVPAGLVPPTPLSVCALMSVLTPSTASPAGREASPPHTASCVLFLQVTADHVSCCVSAEAGRPRPWAVCFRSDLSTGRWFRERLRTRGKHTVQPRPSAESQFSPLEENMGKSVKIFTAILSLYPSFDFLFSFWLIHFSEMQNKPLCV